MNDGTTTVPGSASLPASRTKAPGSTPAQDADAALLLHGLLDGHDAVGALGHGRAGHDLEQVAGREHARRRAAAAGYDAVDGQHDRAAADVDGSGRRSRPSASCGTAAADRRDDRLGGDAAERRRRAARCSDSLRASAGPTSAAMRAACSATVRRRPASQYLGTSGSTVRLQASMPPAIERTRQRRVLQRPAAPRRLRTPRVAVGEDLAVRRRARRPGRPARRAG